MFYSFKKYNFAKKIHSRPILSFKLFFYKCEPLWLNYLLILLDDLSI